MPGTDMMPEPIRLVVDVECQEVPEARQEDPGRCVCGGALVSRTLGGSGGDGECASRAGAASSRCGVGRAAGPRRAWIPRAPRAVRRRVPWWGSVGACAAGGDCLESRLFRAAGAAARGRGSGTARRGAKKVVDARRGSVHNLVSLLLTTQRCWMARPPADMFFKNQQPISVGA